MFQSRCVPTWVVSSTEAEACARTCHARRVRPRFAICAVVLAACTTEPDSVVKPGIINNTVAQNVVIPSTARPGELIAVRVVTLGGGCREFESTDVALSADIATITPYDRYAVGGICTADLRPINHDTTIRFDTPGLKSVHVIARSSGSVEDADLDLQQAISVE